MNPIVLQKLPQVTRSQGIYATIARLDGKAAWEFLTMPLEISWEGSANYSPANTPASPSYQYTKTDTWTLSISGLALSTIQSDRSLTDYVNQLANLRLPDAGKLTPPVLMWKWGQRLLSPCVLTRFTKLEDSWNNNGELMGCKISFSLLQVSDRNLVT